MNELSMYWQDAVYQTLQPRFQVDLSQYTPFYVRQVLVGYVNADYRRYLLRDIPNYIQETADGLYLECDSWLLAADILQNTAHNWYDSGIYDGWRNETFQVTDHQGQPLFALERSAFRPLGLFSHAVHINGYYHKDEQLYFWIAQRSPYKAVSPNQLDNLVGGGIAAGEDENVAMRREGYEEAGLSAAELENAKVAGYVLSMRSVNRGLHRECLHVVDLALSPEFKPNNQDGEVSFFMAMKVEAIAEAIVAGRFMNDAAMALLSTWRRMGLLTPESDLSTWLGSLKLAKACADAIRIQG